MSRNLLEFVNRPPTAATQHIHLRATAYSSPERTLKHLQALLRTCRGFLLEDADLTTTSQSSLNFEVPRHNILDLYSGLLAADLDLNRDSHLRLTSLCTLRRYHPLRGGNISLRLELSFLDATDPAGIWPAAGFA